MPSNWKMFWSYPIIYLSGLLVKAWYGIIQPIENEFFVLSIGWVLIFLISILLDRLFSRISTSEMEQEKEVIRRFVRGERASMRRR